MYLVISLFWGQDMGSDCISSWSLLIFLLCQLHKHLHGRLSPQPQHHAVNTNILMGYEVVLKGTENRAGTKVSEPVEPRFILSQRQISKLGECQTTLCSFSCNCESHLKSASMFHGRNPFSPGAKVVYILPFWWHANKLDTHSWSCRVWVISSITIT